VKSVVNQLIFANVAMFIAQLVFGDTLIVHFALWPLGEYPIGGGQGSVGFEPWQLVSSAFLHGGVSHLALNMFGLWSFGRLVEGALGSRRFFWLYTASVLASGVVQLLWATATIDSGVVPTVGASGGVFGVLLAFGMMFPHQRVLLLFPPIPMKAWIMVIAYTAIELYAGVTGTMQGVAHFAHLGGMLGALVLMLAWRRHWPTSQPRAARET
jgi:rhomboid family protein